MTPVLQDRIWIRTAVLQQQRFQLLAPLDEDLQRSAFDPQTEAESEAFQVDAVAGQEFDVGVVDEADSVQVDHTQVWRVRLDLADVDYLVDLLRFLVRKLERSCVKILNQRVQWRIKGGQPAQLLPPWATD